MLKLSSCYLLCGSPVKRRDGESIEKKKAYALNIYVDCPSCGEYIITDFVQEYFHFPDGPDEALDDADKKTLSRYLKKQYMRGKSSPIIIDTDLIRKITGKESVHYKY